MHISCANNPARQPPPASRTSSKRQHARVFARTTHCPHTWESGRTCLRLWSDILAHGCIQVLPGGKDDASQKLAKIEEELTDLDKIHEQVRQRD